MAYTPTEWTNREVEKPRTYVMTENGDGTVTLTPSEGQVFSPGTPLDATNLNKMEEQIALNDSNLAGKVNKSGDTMTGTLNGTIINASTLQEGGTNLSNKYQAKGSYAPPAQYLTWISDINGVKIFTGNYNGAGKPIYLYLTSKQPGASATEIRVWIQIDSF
jgi:hypothetical protein